MSTEPRDTHPDEQPPTDQQDATAEPTTQPTTQPTTAPAPEADAPPGTEAEPAPESPPGAGTAPAPLPAETPAGAHAAPRPYPPTVPVRDNAPTPPPDEQPTTWAPGPAAAPAPSYAPATESDPAPAPAEPTAAAAATAPAEPAAPAAQAAPAVPVPPVAPTATQAPEYRSRRDVPTPPARPGLGRHLLGVLLGLLITPVGLLLVGVGLARLSDIAGTADMGTDALGLSMLVGGLVLVVALVLLGLWTPALPITGGLVWGIGLGTAYLTVPGRMEDLVDQLTGDAPAPADQLAQTAMSGYLLLVGTVLLAAGVTTAVARRRGRRWGERATVAELARRRTETSRADADHADPIPAGTH